MLRLCREYCLLGFAGLLKDLPTALDYGTGGLGTALGIFALAKDSLSGLDAASRGDLGGAVFGGVNAVADGLKFTKNAVAYLSGVALSAISWDVAGRSAARLELGLVHQSDHSRPRPFCGRCPGRPRPVA